MKKALGTFIITDPAVGTTEIDTFTCCHCQRVVDRVPFKGPTADGIGAWCHLCDAPMCLECVGKGCLPFEKRLEMEEARDRLRRQVDEGSNRVP